MSEVVQRSVEDVEEIADSMGLVCFIPRDNELFLDIDEVGGNVNSRVAEIMELNSLNPISRLVTKSKSGNTHIYLRFKRKFDPDERVALQACLGSDPTKEMLSIIRIREGNSLAAVALFETKIQAIRVKNWRKNGDKLLHPPVNSSMDVDDVDDIPY